MEFHMKFSRRLMMQSSAAALVLGGGAVWLGGKEPSIDLVSKAQAQNLSDLMNPGPLEDMFIGEENAPVTVIEYASMTCPHCASFHSGVLPELKEKYVDTGKVKLIFREFPLDARAYAASMLARCAEKEFYFPMTDVLFKQQSVWARAEDPRPPLLQIAKLAGFTQESFETCLKNQELLDNVNATRKKAAEVFGVTGTPSFFINGEKYSGRVSVEDISAAIDSHL
jgi:protein-disulfide isomerase